VAEAQRWVSSREFAEWAALESVEPWSDTRLDINFARLAALIVSYSERGPKEAVAPREMIIEWWKNIDLSPSEPEMPSDAVAEEAEYEESGTIEVDEMILKKALALNKAFGGLVLGEVAKESEEP
jgi:hypothetical protein